jgi:beta-galactosidase
VKFSSTFAGTDGECGLWADILQPAGAEVVGSYTAGEHAGKAAVTINTFGKGKAVYVGADLDAASLARVLRSITASAGVQPAIEVPAGVEMTVRKSGDKEWLFLLNNTSVEQTVTIARPFTDLLTKQALSGTVELSGYGVRVLQAS